MFGSVISPFSAVTSNEAKSFLGLSSQEYFEASEHGILKRSVEIHTGFSNIINLHNLWDLLEFKMRGLLHSVISSASESLAEKIVEEIAASYDNYTCASFQLTFAEISEILRYADCSIGELAGLDEDQWALLVSEVSVIISSPSTTRSGYFEGLLIRVCPAKCVQDRGDEQGRQCSEVSQDLANVVTAAADDGKKGIAQFAFERATRQVTVSFHVADLGFDGAAAADVGDELGRKASACAAG